MAATAINLNERFGTCRKHSFELTHAVCAHCDHEYCEDCMVFPFGEDQPGYCIDCAFVVAGVRVTSRVRRRRLTLVP
jgi:hypothetical protein